MLCFAQPLRTKQAKLASLRTRFLFDAENLQNASDVESPMQWKFVSLLTETAAVAVVVVIVIVVAVAGDGCADVVIVADVLAIDVVVFTDVIIVAVATVVK